MATSNGNSADQQVCEKTTEAGAKQTGVMQSVDNYEDRTLKLLDREAKEDFGKDAVSLLGGSVFLTKTLIDKSVTFGLPTYGICSAIKTEIKQNQSILKLIWNF